MFRDDGEQVTIEIKQVKRRRLETLLQCLLGYETNRNDRDFLVNVVLEKKVCADSQSGS